VVGNLEKRLEGVCYMESIYPSICLSLHVFMGTCQSLWAEFFERAIIPDHSPLRTLPPKGQRKVLKVKNGSRFEHEKSITE